MILPVALTRRGWSFVLAAVGLWGSWFILGLRDVWYFAALLAATVFVSLVMAVIGTRLARFDVHLTTVDPTPSVGETVELSARVRSALPFPIQVRVLWSIAPARGRSDGGDRDGDRTSSRGSVSARGRDSVRGSVSVRGAGGGRGNGGGTGRGRGGEGDRRAREGVRVERLAEDLVIRPGTADVSRVAWCPRRRGPARVQLHGLAVTDPLGLVVRRARRSETLEMLVLPRPVAALGAVVERESSRDAEGSAARPASAQSSGAPGGAVREYRVGDAPRQIHWKQSARQDELLSNLQERTARDERSMLLDDEGDEHGTAIEFEFAVSAAATIAQRWIRDGHAVRLQVGDAAPFIAATLDEVLRELAVVQPRGVDAPRAASDDQESHSWSVPPVIVAGSVSERLRETLRDDPSGGTVYLVRADPSQAEPSGWRYVRIPLERSGPEDTWGSR